MTTLDSGLDGTFARLAEIFPGVPATTATDGRTWVPFREHESEQAVARLLAEQEKHDDGGPALAAQQLVGRLVGIPTQLLAMAVAAERRLPVATPDQMSVRWIDKGAGPRVGGVAFTSGRMLVLPGDPAATGPDVTVVGGAAELGAELVATVHGLSENVVENASRLSRRGRRALWQTVADRIANGYLLVAKHGGSVEEARRATDAVLSAAPKPLHCSIDWLQIEHAGEQHLYKRKSVCCLIYKAPAFKDDYCSTCPLLDRAENERRLRERLTRA